MKHRETYTDLSSLAWFEEFGVDLPALGGCACTECTGDTVSDLGPSRASIVSGTSALCR